MMRLGTQLMPLRQVNVSDYVQLGFVLNVVKSAQS